MKPVLINTTPQQKNLYAVKRYKDKVFTMPFHMHERYELTYIIKGKGTRIIGDNIKEYEEGDIVLMAPYTPHHWQSTWIKQSSVSAITVFFSNEFPTKEFKLLPEFASITRLLETAKFGIELKGKLRERIAKKLTQLTVNYSLEQMMHLLSILNEIANLKEYNILMDKGFSVSKKQDWERISKIVNHIRINISNKITIKEIADIAFMHTGSVNRFFKQATGFSLIEYINLMRIGMACDLLSGSYKNITDIAFECGFNNLSHFNRIFKRVKKTTPNEYRKQF